MKRKREDNDEIVDEQEHLRRYKRNKCHSSLIGGDEDVNIDVESWKNLSFIVSDIDDFNISFPKVGNLEFNAYNGKYWVMRGTMDAKELFGLEFINDKLVFYVKEYMATKDSLYIYHTKRKILYYIEYKDGSNDKRSEIGYYFRKLFRNIKDHYPDTFRIICNYLHIEDIQDCLHRYYIIKK
jgi:hypothetical protein